MKRESVELDDHALLAPQGIDELAFDEAAAVQRFQADLPPVVTGIAPSTDARCAAICRTNRAGRSTAASVPRPA
jgi:hypothetical protein